MSVVRAQILPFMPIPSSAALVHPGSLAHSERLASIQRDL
jgi:hypothetical protein